MRLDILQTTALRLLNDKRIRVPEYQRLPQFPECGIHGGASITNVIDPGNGDYRGK
jgi:hypothetical protein